MKNIAIIPARGGSKRIPNKNIIEFEKRPMINWTIESAIKSNCFDIILVSTDSQNIADIAVSAGAEVPFLREDFNDDFSSSSEATISALKQAEVYYDERFNIVTQLMPNCPLRGAADIQAAIEKFLSTRVNFQISCSEFNWMNPWWAASLDSDGVPEKIFPEKATQRSQDLAKLYCPVGAIWIAKRQALIEAGTFYGPGHRYLPINWENGIDIDNMEDYLIASKLAKIRTEKKF